MNSNRKTVSIGDRSLLIYARVAGLAYVVVIMLGIFSVSTFCPNAQDPLYHYRTVDWFATDISRSNFDQDILYSLGAFMTICQIKRNNAEQRIKKMAENAWKASKSQ